MLALSACSEGPTASSGDRLTEREAAAIVATVRMSGDGAFGQLGTRSGELATHAPPTRVDVEHTSTHPCPRGGRIGIELDATLQSNSDARSFAIDAEGRLIHQSCAVQENGVTLTLNGDPNLAFELHATVSNEQPVGDFRSAANGAFNWSASDGRSGRCAVAIEDVVDFTAKRRTVEGEVCGHTIRQVTSWN